MFRLICFLGIVMAHMDPPGDIMPTVIHSHGVEEISVAYLRRDLEGYWTKDTPKKATFSESGEKKDVVELSVADHDFYTIEPQTFLASFEDGAWLMVNPYEELYPAVFLLKDQQVKRLKLPFKSGKPMSCFGVAADLTPEGRRLGYFLLSDSEPPNGEFFIEEPASEEEAKSFYDGLKRWTLELWAYDLDSGALVFKEVIPGPVRAHGNIKLSNLLKVGNELAFVTEKADPKGFPDSWFPLVLNRFDLTTREWKEEPFSEVFQLSTVELALKKAGLWCVYTSIPEVGGLSEITVKKLP